SPLAGDHGVMSQVPPEVVCQILRAAVRFPRSLDLEGFGIEKKDAARTFAISGTDGIHVHAVWPAVRGMGAAVAGFLLHFLGLNHLSQRGLAGIGLGVKDVNAGRLQPRY